MKPSFYFFDAKPYTLELTLAKALNPKIHKLKISVSGFTWFRGARNLQMDFTKGARADRVKGGRCEFDCPLPEAPLPPSFAKLL